jgi:hypothetical protein
MHRTLAVLVCALGLASVGRADPGDGPQIPGMLPIPRPSHNVKEWTISDYDDTPGAQPGGIVFGRQNGQWFFRIGGGLLPMRVRTTEWGPDGPVKTWTVYPSAAQSSWLPLTLQHHPVPGAAASPAASPIPAVPPAPASDRAYAQVSIPDPIGLLYIDGRLTETRGTARRIESPSVAPGTAHVFRLRAAFQLGENLLIEEKEVVVRAGQVADVTFDGQRTRSVPLPRSGGEAMVSGAAARREPR